MSSIAPPRLVYGILQSDSERSRPSVDKSPDHNLSSHELSANKIREMTIAWSRYYYRGEIIEGDHPDAILQQAISNGYDYCLIQRNGHIISEKWHSPSNAGSGFYGALESLLEQNFLIVADYETNANGSIEFDTNCMLVNLNHYQKLDTGLFSQFISQLDSPILPLPQPMRDNRYVLEQYQQFFDSIEKQTTHAKNGVFLFNIEPYDELINCEDDQNLSALFSVAAGFKANRILHTQGFNRDTQVVFFDYSRQALNIRQQMVAEWDGVDFPDYARHLFNCYPHPETFYQLWEGVTPETVSVDDLQLIWQQELDTWGGAQVFKQHWQHYKTLQHHYIECDLLQDPAPLYEQLSQFQSPYIWWSNAFFTVFGNWFHSAEQRKHIYQQWLTGLSKASPDCQLNGADYNNLAINNITAVNYAAAFSQNSGSELKPQAYNSIEINF